MPDSWTHPIHVSAAIGVAIQSADTVKRNIAASLLSEHIAEQAAEIARLKAENGVLRAERDSMSAQVMRDERDCAEDAERMKDGQLAELQRANHALRMPLYGEVLKITSEAFLVFRRASLL